jgi:hypothetical protein
MLAGLWKTKNYLFVGVTFTSGVHSPELFKCLASISEGVLLLNPFYWVFVMPRHQRSAYQCVTRTTFLKGGIYNPTP